MTRPPSSARRSPRRPRPARRGFTLVEAIATMVVLAVVLGSTSRLILVATDGYSQSSVRNQLHIESSIAMDRIARELQHLPLKAGGGTRPDITSVGTSSITWNTDYALSLSGTNLMFTEDGGTPRVLLGDVTAFTIACFNESNTAIAAPIADPATDAIRRIAITLTTTRSGTSETLRTRVFLRACTTGGESQ